MSGSVRRFLGSGARRVPFRALAVLAVLLPLVARPHTAGADSSTWSAFTPVPGAITYLGGPSAIALYYPVLWAFGETLNVEQVNVYYTDRSGGVSYVAHQLALGSTPLNSPWSSPASVAPAGATEVAPTAGEQAEVYVTAIYPYHVAEISGVGTGVSQLGTAVTHYQPAVAYYKSQPHLFFVDSTYHVDELVGDYSDPPVYNPQVRSVCCLTYTPPAAVDYVSPVTHAESLVLFVVGTDDRIYDDVFNGSSWSGIAPVCCLTGNAPAVAEYNGLLYLVAVGTDHHVYSMVYDGRTWSGFSPIGNITTYSAPSLTANFGQLYLFVTDPTGQIQESTLGTFKP